MDKEFDVELYESVVRKCTPPLYRYCSYRLKYDHQLTEEAVNDTLRILFVKWDTLDITDDILRYLYRVADNCIKQARARDTKYYSKHSSLEEAMDEGIVGERAYLDDYFHDINSDDKFIADVISSLSDEYKDIFKYRFIEKKTIVETAEIIHIPYSSLRMRIKKIEEHVKDQVINNY